MSYPIEAFHVGDRVRFREWADMKAEYGSWGGCIPVVYGFTWSMKSLCGTEATIERLGDVDVVLKDFEIGDEGSAFAYSLGMIEPIAYNVSFNDRDFLAMLEVMS